MPARGLWSVGFAAFVFLAGCGATKERVAMDPVFIGNLCERLGGVWTGSKAGTDRRTVGTFVLTLECDGRRLSAASEDTMETEMGIRTARDKAINVWLKPDGFSYEVITSSGRILSYQFSLEEDSLVGTSDWGTDTYWFNLKKRP